MQEDLENLICNINTRFLEYGKLWEMDDLYKKINLKKKSVKDINTENNILETIYAYQSFLSKKTVDLELSLKQQTADSKIYTRIKTLDSIKYKIEHYINDKPEKGGVPICKCLNDIFGIRIVQQTGSSVEQIKDFLGKKGFKFKCIDSSKGLYKAIHVYFLNTNYDFQWELQIWKEEDRKTNVDSHAQHKQYYTKWITGRRQ